MSFFRDRNDRRKEIFLSLVGSIETQLRDAFAKKNADGLINQSQLADKLGVDRSAVNRRLTGQTNMRISTLADMIWALDQCIDVKIYDPAENRLINHPLGPETIPENNVVELDRHRTPTASTSSAVRVSKIEAML
ncbi:helix-turn-helix domain-containing protein [Methylobacterium sp. yr668]|uniref:helix-turn-helix domain-containing protein n=1 Tax=Methylobacterium sp. yr668 TaxID=1761801 RepID=UPI001114CD52|nr:helix-turn-helix domain-containing protein [Methylobacterium sp. yr668]